LDVKQLKYFIEVTKSGSFTRAANQLYITQPAISRIIKSLEDELGVPLFVRSRKHLSLTEAGKVFYNHAQQMEEQYHALLNDLEQLVTLQKGHLRIGLPSIINSFFFSQFLAAFHREYPEITFQLVEDGSKRIEEKVANDELDFGVVVLPTQHHVFDNYSFVKEKLKIIVPSSHRLAAREKIELKELREEAFIMFNKDFALRDNIIQACNESGFKPKIISETSQLDFIEEMVASKLGITLLPESTSMELTSDVIAIPVANPAIDWDLALIWKNDVRLSHVMQEFIRFAKEKLLQK
jgi:DNA-binding transcriptional LysR family regulator